MSGGRLRWSHWIIIALSIALTTFAWYYSESQKDARIEANFHREADQLVELVRERMQKYEDALYGGVALIRTLGGDVDFDRWRQYADSIDIELKYPGINGIGVIHKVPSGDIADYLAEQRARRPGFRIHPEHDREDKMPITFVIPVEGNEQAVGLDMAHESNRYQAACKSCDTGLPQITGPITLVQDSGKTPGFLFYAPFYSSDETETAEERAEAFSGLVYAPFVVRKLMEGVLGRERRYVGLRLLDNDEILYDEHVESEADYDPDPLYKKTVEVDFYGRAWTFDIWSAQSFRAASTDHQPLTILIGGLLIDSLLILLFLSISNASKKALNLADTVTGQLRAKTDELVQSERRLASHAKQLEASNADLEQFAYVASHDLQEPLRKVGSFAQLLQEECSGQFSEDANEYVSVVVKGVERMKTLVQDLLEFSRVGRQEHQLSDVDANACLRTALDHLEVAIRESGAVVEHAELPPLLANEKQLTQLFQNLVGNAIKYQSGGVPAIEVGGRDRGEFYEVSVKDNGIGIEPQYYQRVFEVFQRLHNRREYSGTGIGLAICKRIVEHCGGEIWLESEPGRGTTFYFTMLKADPKGITDAGRPESQPAGAAR